MVHTMRLAPASADLDIVWEASLDGRVPLEVFYKKHCLSKMAYPHSSMQRASNLVILLEPWTAPQDLGQPELADSTLHVANLALSRWRSLNPLRRLAANTADHVGMGQRLRRSLLRLDVERRGNRLGDAGVERRRPAGNDQVGVTLVARAWAGIEVAGPRPRERGVGVERGRHCGGRFRGIGQTSEELRVVDFSSP